MKPLAVAADFRRLRTLQRARRAVQNTNFNHRPPEISWRSLAKDGAVAQASAEAVRSAIVAALPAATLKTQTLAAIDAQVAEIKAKYQGISIEED